MIEGKALQLGAVECHVVDAREEFAREYVAPAIKANALYGGGYPLFTALGRPLIAKLAVEYARKTGCDTIAHGCTGKGNDQVRIEATIATLAPELKVIAPVRSWQMGREEEIAYAREHGIPVKGGTEIAPYSIDDNLWGRSSEGRWIEDLDHAPEDDVFQLVTRPEQAPDEPETVELSFERGVPVALDGERLGLVELIERAAEIGARHGVGIVDHIEDRIVGLKVRDIYEAPAAGDHPARPPGARAARLHDPPEPVQGPARPPVGLPRLRRPVVGAAARRPRRLHGQRQRAGHRHDRHQALQGPRARRHALLAQRRLRRQRSRPSRSPAACSRRPPRRASSSCGRCSRAWPGACATSRAGRSHRPARRVACRSIVMAEGDETHGGERGGFSAGSSAARSGRSEGDLLAERRARRAAESGEVALTRRAEAAEATVQTLERHVASLQQRLREAEDEQRMASGAARGGARRPRSSASTSCAASSSASTPSSSCASRPRSGSAAATAKAAPSWSASRAA